MKNTLIFIAIAVVAGLGWWIYDQHHATSTNNVNTNSSVSATVNLVAGENFWGDIAAQIGGSYVRVTSIISDPSADPHLYESSAANASAIATADVVITNGLGYDDFMDKLVAASPNTNRTVLSAATILQVSGNDANPHLWYDLPKVHLVAEAIESTLAAKDPAHAAFFNANLATFTSSLQPLLTAIDTIKSKYPGAHVAYTERVPGYLLADAGLTVSSPSGFASAIEEGNDPSPSDTVAFQNLITSHGIKVLLYNAQATSAVTQHIQDLAHQNNIPVVGVTETLPANEPHYQSWQQDQLNALLTGLGG